MKLIKKCTSYGNEESFKILSGSTILKSSPSFTNNEQRTLEYCLTASTNSQYTVRLIDSYGDSWSSGAWLAAYGLYGNAVFKNFLTEPRQEEYTLSLYYAVTKADSWKMLAGPASIDPSWNTLNFSDGSWQQVTLGSAPATTSGTQYFRKQFTGIPNMAAYELQLKYRFGIIAYVNGKEVYRDYMPEGPVTPSTPSTGSSTSLAFHGVLRPSGEFTTSTNILAVELHFSQTQTEVDFDAYMSMVASSVPDSQCFIYAATTTTTFRGIFDFAKWGSYNTATSALPKTGTFTFKGPRPYINAIRIFPYTSPHAAPASFDWEGRLTATSAWTNIFSIRNAFYRTNTYSVYRSYFNAKAYSSYQMKLNAAVDSTTMYVYEAQPLVCAEVLPTGIHFAESSYSFYANYESASILPLEADMSGCTITPALPAGLTLSSSCAITGVPTIINPATSYTVQSVIGGQTYTGTVSIETKGCTGTVAKIVRTYKTGATNERFVVTDAATQQPVLTVTSGQIPSETKEYVICLTGNKYTVSVSSTTNYWASGSYLYVRLMLSVTEYDTAARMRYDANLSLNHARSFIGQFSVAPSQAWQYKMGQVPANWQTESGWTTASMGSFPASTNQIQLYKNTFNVASLDDVAGFVISLRYLYGCVVYMNNVEVFRNGVEGDLSASSISTNNYNNILYHQISLPVKTMAIGDQPSVSYLQQGSNTIAIAIVSQMASQTTSYFDCAVRLMGSAEESRAYDFTSAGTAMSGSPSSFGSQYYSTSVYSEKCADNAVVVTFANDRREWISSVNLMLYYTQNSEQAVQFNVKARNTNLDEWTSLKNVTGLAWSLLGQHKKVWLENNKPWNQYRFENFASGNTQACKWKLGNIDFLADAIPATVPDLTFTATTLSLFKDIEMGEVYANANYYRDFTVQPALPAGVKLDTQTGTFCGTASAESAAQTYTVTATKVSGGSTTAVVTLSVSICTGGKSLITLVARTDSYPAQCSYKLYSGKGTSGEVLASVPSLRGINSLNYGDFCLPHNIYTIELIDSLSNGWNNPAGYYLTVDMGTMIFETGQVPNKVASVSTMFSSLLPFQIEYDDWKLQNDGTQAPDNWKNLDFDDSQWPAMKAALFGEHMGTTAYVRREVQIPSIEDYHVLNVRMKYTGGIAAYFNGRLVARFNLPESFAYDTAGLDAHDASVFSKFHIILPTSGAVTGKNVFAVEIHRSTQSALVFDATGVFGVNECSVVVDSFALIDGTAVTTTNFEGLMDLSPVTYGYQTNTVGSHLHWIVENLEGSKFNSFGMQTVYKRTSYGFSVYVRFNEEEEYTSALALLNQETKERDRSTWPIPLAIAGFKEFKFQVDDTASSSVYVGSYVMEYCQRSGANVCPGIGDFPPVTEGEISPSACEDGFRGYAYRQCTNGQLSEIKTDMCEYKLPDHLAYPKSLYTFVIDLDLQTDVPTYQNRITEFYMQEDTPLPSGLSLDPITGVISGRTISVFDSMSFTVRGKNPKGETLTVINISSRKGYCAPDGVFERTDVGKIAEYDCAMKGSYVGTQKRACVLGKVDGEWQKASGFCMPVMVIVLLVIIVIVVIVVVVMMLMRSMRKTKSVGGVKAKSAKSTKSSKSAKKTTSKSVKV